MTDVTVIVLTKNEERNLPDCLKSLEGFAKRVVVVDSFSTDDTRRIAQAAGAQFYQHEFENYARQFNWALDHTQIATRWVLRLDADERLTPELCAELEQIARDHRDDDVNGVIMEAWLYFLGRKIKHGCHNKRKLMFFKYGIGRIEDINMDEHTILSEGVSVSAKNRFIHYDFKDMNHWVDKMNWYATREVQDYFDFKRGNEKGLNTNDSIISGNRRSKYGLYYRLPMFSRCWFLFIYNYIFRLGFLDGREGYIYNYMYHRWYRTLVDTKIFEKMKK